jgi:ADP-heptose:LPS heptosyltransferase
MKILIIRFSSIGDIIVTTSILRCLKKQLQAEIHYLVKPQFISVLQNNPNIDKLVSYRDGVVKELQAEKYDLVIDLHKSLQSSRIRWQIGARSLTYDKMNIEKWIFVNFKKDLLPSKHLVDRYFEGIASLGVKNDGEGLDFFLNPEKIEFDLPGSYEVIVLGAAHLTKRITTVLANRIIDQAKLPIILLGGKDVIEQTEQIEFPEATINLVGKTSLNQSGLILQNASLVHTGDTGLMHMAAALKVPTHVYWANTHPKMGMYPYYGEYKIHTKWYEVDGLSCRPCSKLGHEVCPMGHHKCMEHQV